MIWKSYIFCTLKLFCRIVFWKKMLFLALNFAKKLINSIVLWKNWIFWSLKGYVCNFWLISMYYLLSYRNRHPTLVCLWKYIAISWIFPSQFTSFINFFVNCLSLIFNFGLVLMFVCLMCVCVLCVCLCVM